MEANELDYDLPRTLIAQEPLSRREDSRMMILRDDHVEHALFRDLPELLREGDLLVVNDSKVLPAKICGRKVRDGKAIDVLLVRELSPGTWEIMCRGVKVGDQIDFGGLSGTVVRDGNGLAMRFEGGDVMTFAKRMGMMPLPPYIHRDLEEPHRYQTVFAEVDGSLAAPTAGLHFSEDVIKRLTEAGVRFAEITLHVGPATFLPIRINDLSKHRPRAEWFSVPEETVHRIALTKEQGGRVLGVGTTTIKALESACDSSGPRAQEGWSDLFIRPPYAFSSGVDALLTNFHLPRSTNLALLAAWCGRENVLRAYQLAIEERYRFYSFGDCMLAWR